MFKRIGFPYKVIPHDDQRYNTTGDYQTDESGYVTILISDLGSRRMEFLIAVHESIESYLCKKNGISEAIIDKFDMWFEANRAPGDFESEPGDHPDCPYLKEHQFATKIEKFLAKILLVNWDEYGQKCVDLTASYESL